MEDKKVELVQVGIFEASRFLSMQRNIFWVYAEKYGDRTSANPATKTLIETRNDMMRHDTKYFWIRDEDYRIVGGVRIKEINDNKIKVGPLMIVNRERGRGYGTATLFEIERLNPGKTIELGTILQEEKLMNFYRNAGYVEINEIINVNENMDIVIFRKG